MKATLINKQTGEHIDVRTTTRHPLSKGGQSIWVDRDNNAYLQVKVLGEYVIETPTYKIEVEECELQRYDIGQQIVSHRLGKGLTVRQLAAQAGITAANLSNIEQGNYSTGVDIIQRICAALGTKLLIK